ncbi:MAG: LLM class flavin-dependent oxidoreductase [Limnohabitans sp.]
MRVGLFLPTTWPPDAPERLDVGTLGGLAQRAAEAGYDSLWVPDHVDRSMARGKPVWDSAVVLGALAESTDLMLGSLVMSAPLRPAAVVAGMANTLAAMTRGRFVLGIGSGWSEGDLAAVGYGPRSLVEGFVPYVSKVRASLATVVPLLIAAHGPKMLRIAAREADWWNDAWYDGPEAFRPSLDAMEQAIAEVGRERSTIRVTVGVDVGPDARRLDRALAGFDRMHVDACIVRARPLTLRPPKPR